MKETVLTSWFEDKIFPRPDLLFMVIEALNRSTGIIQEPVAEFNLLFDKLVSDISPCKAADVSNRKVKRDFPDITLREYIYSPAFGPGPEFLKD